MEAKEQISGEWVRNELMVAANTYQAFPRQVWEAIIKRSKTEEVQRMHEATQVAQMHDAVTFLLEANLTRNTHLMEFQGNVEKWAADHQQKVETLEQQRNEDQQRMAGLEQRLTQAQDELLRVATAVRLPATPTTRTRPEPPTAQDQAGAHLTRLALEGPLFRGLQRRGRPPAVPAEEGGAGGNGSPPRPPRRTTPRSPSPPPSEGDGDLYE